MGLTFTGFDLLLISIYFAAVLALGFLARRKRAADATDYLLAGRSLTTPVFVMTLVSTWYGGILGVGEFSYRYGISNWIVQGVPYYVFAALFAVLLAERVRSTNFMTIPDKLLAAYDRPTALIGSMLVFILTTPAPYILMIGVLLQLVTGWSLMMCLIIGTLASAVYLGLGGFRADVYTDILEFVLMFLGFLVLLPFAVTRFGGWDFIVNHVPTPHLSWHGGNSFQFILAWFFIALWTLVDPAFHQRCYAAKSGKVARRGILLSIIFWFLFDAMTATAGLYARAALPNLDQPVMAYPLLAELTLPSGAKGIFFIGMLATIMSTLNSATFVSATTFGRDIVWRLRKAEHEAEIAYTRWGLFLASALSIVLCVLIPSVIQQWYTIGTIVVPALLIPLVTSYFDVLKVRPPYAIAGMTLPVITSFSWFLFGSGDGQYPLDVEPMFPGLAVGCVVWMVGRVRRRD